MQSGILFIFLTMKLAEALDFYHRSPGQAKYNSTEKYTFERIKLNISIYLFNA